MTNEELAVLIQQGNAEYIPQLWEQIKRLVIKRASRLVNSTEIRGGAELEDFVQSGFFAMMNAVRYFKPGYQFSTFLYKTLYNSFKDASGYRKNCRFDLVDCAQSLDSPIKADGTGEDVFLIDFIEDPGAAEFPNTLCDRDAWNRLCETLYHAMNELPEEQQKVLHSLFWERNTRAEAAKNLGVTEKEVCQAADEAIKYLRRPAISRELRRCMKEWRG